jgi:hypothetical protein
MEARTRVGIELSYQHFRLHRLVESILWDQFLGSLKVKKLSRKGVLHKIVIFKAEINFSFPSDIAHRD